MRRLRELLRLKYEAGLSHRAIAQACAVGLGTVTTYLQRATAAGLAWPLPDDLDDAALEARLFARPAVPRARPGGPRLAPAAPGTEEAGRHALPAVAGVSRAASGRLRLQPVLRAVSPVGAGAEAVDAPGASRRREAVCRFLRQAAAPGRSADRRGDRGRTLRRRARRERLDLRRGHAEPGSAVVGRRARPHAGLLSGQSRDLGPGQFEERRHDGQPLRAGDQPHLRRARPPLWRGGHSRARRRRRPTNRKSKSVSRSRSAGSWRRCGTARSSRSPI